MAERTLRAARYSVPTLNWIRMPSHADGTAEPPAFGLDEILDGVAAAGFADVGLDELAVGTVSATQAADALRERGLSCSDVGILRAAHRDETRLSAARLAELAGATGATSCIAIVDEPARRDPVVSLEGAADILAASGVRLALEFTAYASLTTLEETIEVCAALGWERCGILLDSWHFFRGDLPWSLLESLDGSQIELVHLNDGPHVADPDPMRESRFRRQLPGEGSFDLDRFLDVLSGIGYEGTISLEILSSRIAATPPAAAARDLMTALVSGGFAQGRQELSRDPT